MQVLLDSAVPASFMVPVPNDDVALTEDEDPLEDGSLFDENAEDTAGA